jgi:SEC-C motif-containing protein
MDDRRNRLPLERCCGPYLADFEGTPAPDVPSLMRSRYTAYVMGDEAYLLGTWHAGTRPASVDIDPAMKWLGLEVRAHRLTGADSAEVEFVARYRVNGRGARLHETSRFVRESGRWFYIDGDLK